MRSANDADDCPPTELECSLDGADFAICHNGDSLPTGLPPGQHAFSARGYDTFENQGATDSVSWNVNP